MPNVDGKEYPYTKAGMRAAEKARARNKDAKTPFDKTREANTPKTKGDMMASNVMGTLKNIGY